MPILFICGQSVTALWSEIIYTITSALRIGGLKMNKVVMIGTAIAALVGGPALAADIPLKAPPAPAVIYNWTGFYGGIHGGWGRTDTRWLGPATFFGVTAFDADSDGGIFGFHAGYNFQFSQFVLG